MSKLHNVRGRITYISSHAKQENLYAVYETTDRYYWTELARFNQQEFLKSGTEGKCIEARELIIALPESFTDLYNPDRLLQLFTNRFKEKYGVECVSALHHNKRKTNYHIHLIFSERELLPEPIEKIATRNMFFDEKGKHMRTKKEILDDNGDIRKGCKVVKKGEVYEQNPFTIKTKLFKQENFLDEAKHFYTVLINSLVDDEKDRLKVFQTDELYLPTKKVGKNNPKEKEILETNRMRMLWNIEVDRALVSKVPEADIRQIKKEYISNRVRDSILIFGNVPERLDNIISTALMALALLISKVLKKALELKQKLFESELALSTSSLPETVYEAPKEATTVKEVTVSENKAPVRDSECKVVTYEVEETQKPTIPPKPVMSQKETSYPKLDKIAKELKELNDVITAIEKKRALLEIQRDELKGPFKLIKRGELQKKIDQKNAEADRHKQTLASIVKKYGFETVHAFYKEYYSVRTERIEFHEKLAEWNETYGTPSKPKTESLSERLQRCQKEADERNANRSYNHTPIGRGAR